MKKVESNQQSSDLTFKEVEDIDPNETEDSQVSKISRRDMLIQRAASYKREE